MRHTDIWKAVDTLAERNGLSASGLARRAGLDPTAFNKSKRANADGSPRWLSTESLSKVLQAVGSSLEDFAALAEAGGAYGERLIDPLDTEAAVARCFDALRAGRSALLQVQLAPHQAAGTDNLPRKHP
jgi:phage repressor protein C with HTH and peptisase S24 domain